MSATSIPARFADLPREGMLRLVLKLDAAVTGVNGAAYLAAAGPLADLLGVSPDLLRPVGAFLVVFAIAVAWAASRPSIPRAAVMAIVDANAAWAIGSLAFLALGAFSPTVAGGVWIALQAVVVGGFAALQLSALRRA